MKTVGGPSAAVVDEDPEQEAKIRKELSRSITRPPQVFQGSPLWPFSKAASMLFSQIREEGDTGIYLALALVTILKRRGGESFEADARDSGLLRKCWGDLSDFRLEILGVRNSMSDADCAEAFRILNEELGLEFISEVLATAEPPKPVKGSKKNKRLSRPMKSGRRQ